MAAQREELAQDAASYRARHDDYRAWYAGQQTAQKGREQLDLGPGLDKPLNPLAYHLPRTPTPPCRVQGVLYLTS